MNKLLTAVFSVNAMTMQYLKLAVAQVNDQADDDKTQMINLYDVFVGASRVEVIGNQQPIMRLIAAMSRYEEYVLLEVRQVNPQ